ncbi:NADH-cytochrome b5 reductase 3 [Orobanche gracilis]
MAIFLKRLAKAAPISFGGQTMYGSRLPFGALAAISGGMASYYFYSSANLVYLDQLNEDTTPKVALNPEILINGLNSSYKTRSRPATILSYLDIQPQVIVTYLGLPAPLPPCLTHHQW